MTGDDLRFLSAWELAERIRAGDISAREAVEQALARIEASADLNAFTYLDPEGALAAADEVRPGDPRPFAGVPTAIKDLTPASGMPRSNGSWLFGDYRPDYDAYAVRLLREAGFIFLGKTNAPEFGIVPVTEPRRFRPTRNPWDLSRTPGGSSGGAAAAVAAGALPVAHASDGGGSIRIPAACCGLVGLKPSRGRISSGPDAGESFLSTQGVLTRTVEDTARILDIMSGYEPGDATWAPPPAESFTAAMARAPQRLRVALVTEPPIRTAVDPMSASAATQTAHFLANLGHDVAVVAPPAWRSEGLIDAFTSLWAASIASGVRAGAVIAGQEPGPDDIEPLTRAFYEQGLALGALDYLAALGRLQSHARRLVQVFDSFDVMLTPALGQRPLAIGELDTCAADPMAEFEKSWAFTPFNAIWNVTGQPAITLPLYQGDDGLPLGVQFVGPPAGEGLLLSLAAQLEDALPWRDRHPSAI